jgi:hypothetical protein
VTYRIKLRGRYCVYADFTCEAFARCFYIGKGTEDRVNLFSPRNIVHERITAKYGLKREVVFETDDELFALDTEVRLIAERKTFVHGGHDHWGANLTLGGDGTSGHIPSEQQRHNMSVAIRAAFQRDPSIAQRTSARQKRLMSDPIHVKKVSDGIKAAWAATSEEVRAVRAVKNGAAQRGKPSPVRGVKSPKTNLTEDDVRFIKLEFLSIMKNGVEADCRGAFVKTVEALARKTQETYQTIYKIVRGTTWKHINVERDDECI